MNTNNEIIEPTEEGMAQNNPNLNLENLAVENILLYPPFEPFTLNYDIEIPNDMETLNILAIPESEQSRVAIIGNTKLKEGQNKIRIIVTSISEEKREYIINAHKRNKQEEEKYIQDKEMEIQQLEEIYETYDLYQAQRLSVNKTIETVDSRKNTIKKDDESKNIIQNNYFWLVIGIVILIGIILFGIKLKKK